MANVLLCSWVFSLFLSYIIAVHQVANLEKRKLYGSIVQSLSPRGYLPREKSNFIILTTLKVDHKTCLHFRLSFQIAI